MCDFEFDEFAEVGGEEGFIEDGPFSTLKGRCEMTDAELSVLESLALFGEVECDGEKIESDPYTLDPRGLSVFANYEVRFDQINVKARIGHGDLSICDFTDLAIVGEGKKVVDGNGTRVSHEFFSYPNAPIFYSFTFSGRDFIIVFHKRLGWIMRGCNQFLSDGGVAFWRRDEWRIYPFSTTSVLHPNFSINGERTCVLYPKVRNYASLPEIIDELNSEDNLCVIVDFMPFKLKKDRTVVYEVDNGMVRDGSGKIVFEANMLWPQGKCEFTTRGIYLRERNDKFDSNVLSDVERVQLENIKETFLDKIRDFVGNFSEDYRWSAPNYIPSQWVGIDNMPDDECECQSSAHIDRRESVPQLLTYVDQKEKVFNHHAWLNAMKSSGRSFTYRDLRVFLTQHGIYQRYGRFFVCQPEEGLLREGLIVTVHPIDTKNNLFGYDGTFAFSNCLELEETDIHAHPVIATAEMVAWNWKLHSGMSLGKTAKEIWETQGVPLVSYPRGLVRKLFMAKIVSVVMQHWPLPIREMGQYMKGNFFCPLPVILELVQDMERKNILFETNRGYKFSACAPSRRRCFDFSGHIWPGLYFAPAEHQSYDMLIGIGDTTKSDYIESYQEWEMFCSTFKEAIHDPFEYCLSWRYRSPPMLSIEGGTATELGHVYKDMFYHQQNGLQPDESLYILQNRYGKSTFLTKIHGKLFSEYHSSHEYSSYGDDLSVFFDE